jgi:hypothetical protein
LHFRQDDRTAAIALDYVNVDRHSDRHQIEFWLVTVMRICRQVTDGRLAPSHLRVRHSRDAIPAEFKTFFGTDVEFGAGADEVVFPAHVASLPNVGRDNYLNNSGDMRTKPGLSSRAAASGSSMARSAPRSSVEGRLLIMALRALLKAPALHCSGVLRRRGKVLARVVGVHSRRKFSRRAGLQEEAARQFREPSTLTLSTACGHVDAPHEKG